MTQKIQKITASEAAKILKISKTRVLQLIKLNIIPAERVGRQFILRKPDVLAAKGRKAGRPRKKSVQTVSAAHPISTQEAKIQELEALIRNKVQSKQQNVESTIFSQKPNRTISPINYQTVPRPSVTKTDTNDDFWQVIGLGFDE
jgi:excisionase family DNA binding protein